MVIPKRSETISYKNKVYKAKEFKRPKKRNTLIK